ncbi:hypothetical protein [Desulfopila inferna]|uniref:hypothetical protein n=1 Tax=Desulfopila inferna TaxID=468528 RepID=UPI001964CA98|nr:hypothetical protein [Desulfopila inferna]MBM9603743.1 hypothetical protein [Desulfopila inferna]
MIELRKIKRENIPSALELAKQYRLLNEPDEAESICLDILEVDPDHQDTLITLLLALTDKFSSSGLSPSFEKAKAIVDRLPVPYCKSYYRGILYERRAKNYLKQEEPGGGAAAYQWFAKAMKSYDEAIKTCDPSNQDAVLRWNSCARIINSNPEVRSEEKSAPEMLLDAYDEPH